MTVRWPRPEAVLVARACLVVLLGAMAVGLLSAACRRSSADPPPLPPPTAASSQPPAATPAALRPIALPQDDAPHADATTEWWYENGHLDAEDGSRYAFHYVVFLVTAPGQFQATVAQVAVTDFASGAYLTDQRGRIGAIAPSAEGFAFDLDGWRMAGGAGRDLLVTGVGGYALVLTTEPRKSPALHKGNGIVGYANGSLSAYYSRTRMDVTGSLTVQGREKRVRGSAWFDHQWGNFDARATRWDWFALQLDDGADLMLSLVRDLNDRPVDTYGTHVTPGGTATHLASSQFSVEAVGAWASPVSGVTYPMGWRVRVPGLGVDVALTPVTQAAEFDARRSTGNLYWEGPVTVSGSHGGRGFVEMAGYAPSQPVTPRPPAGRP